VALVSGQVAQTQLVLGKTVQAGDVLVQLDDRSERLAQEEGQTRLTDLHRRLDAVAKEIQAEKQAALDHRRAGTVSLDELRARIEEAQARAKFTDWQLDKTKKLLQTGDMSQKAFNEAQAEAEANRAAVRALQLALTHKQTYLTAQESDRQVRLAKLQRERDKLTGELETQEATLRRLARDMELRKVRAPVAGRVGQVSEFPVGAAVIRGEKLGYVVPEGDPHAVAFFPVAAAGRIRAGQSARLRLDGFPWTQYGSIPTTVKTVATEAGGGLLRVELELRKDPGLSIPIEHGLPGQAEVKVEQISPAVLVLRSIGWFLRPNRSLGMSSHVRSTP
jgi:membrane fusion protein (multidrug efflux system)